MIHRIGCGLVIGPTLTRHVAADVARKVGETTTAHLKPDAVAGAKDIGTAPQSNLRLDNGAGVHEGWLANAGHPSSLPGQPLHAQPIDEQLNPTVGG